MLLPERLVREVPHWPAHGPDRQHFPITARAAAQPGAGPSSLPALSQLDAPELSQVPTFTQAAQAGMAAMPSLLHVQRVARAEPGCTSAPIAPAEARANPSEPVLLMSQAPPPSPPARSSTPFSAGDDIVPVRQSSLLPATPVIGSASSSAAPAMPAAALTHAPRSAAVAAPVPAPLPMVVLLSGVDMSVVRSARKLASRGLLRFSRAWVDDATHLILPTCTVSRLAIQRLADMSEQEWAVAARSARGALARVACAPDAPEAEHLAKSRSIPYLVGIARGTWLLHGAWLSACEFEGAIAHELPYTVRGDIDMLTSKGGPAALQLLLSAGPSSVRAGLHAATRYVLEVGAPGSKRQRRSAGPVSDAAIAMALTQATTRNVLASQAVRTHGAASHEAGPSAATMASTASTASQPPASAAGFVSAGPAWAEPEHAAAAAAREAALPFAGVAVLLAGAWEYPAPFVGDIMPALLSLGAWVLPPDTDMDTMTQFAAAASKGHGRKVFVIASDGPHTALPTAVQACCCEVVCVGWLLDSICCGALLDTAAYAEHPRWQ